MKPVLNTVPNFAIIYPPGTKLKWVTARGLRPLSEEVIVKGWRGGCEGCSDCDGIQYIVSDESLRCHYRKSESMYGLCYWEEVK